MANVITNKTEQYRKGKTHDSLQLNESKQANHKLAVSYDIRPGNEVAPICSTNRRALHGAYPQAASNYSNICECDIQQYRIGVLRGSSWSCVAVCGIIYSTVRTNAGFPALRFRSSVFVNRVRNAIP